MLRSQLVMCRLASSSNSFLVSPFYSISGVRNYNNYRSGGGGRRSGNDQDGNHEYSRDSSNSRRGGYGVDYSRKSGYNGRGFNSDGRYTGVLGFRGGFNRAGGGFASGRRSDNFNLDLNVNFEKLEPLTKNFYKENFVVKARAGPEIDDWLKQNNIEIQGKDLFPPAFSFDELSFPEPIVNFLKDNYKSPTSIQSISWPTALAGNDLISIAQTGSGKTLGFMLPGIVHAINQPNHKSPNVLVMAPTRELAVQVHSVSEQICKKMGFNTAICYGGASKEHQHRQLRQNPRIVIGTPGRLMDFMKALSVDFSQTSYVVLDEADRMLDMGFEPIMRQILRCIRPDKQLLMFSATWPKEVRRIAADFQKNPVFINVGSLELTANPDIEQIIEVVQDYDKTTRITELVKDIRSKDEKAKILIFCSMKRTVDNLMYTLRNAGLTSALNIHGDKSQNERDFAMNEFRRGACRMLVATDVAARGIDVADISHVINFDMPKGIEDYVHRIGRTARAGRKGTAISFFSYASDAGIASQLIQQLKETNQKIPTELQITAKPNAGGYGDGGRQAYN